MNNKYKEIKKKIIEMLRVGTIKHRDGKRIFPSYPGFTIILVLTKSSKYGALGPYELKELKDNEDVIMENKWQFSKVYRKVGSTTQRYSRWDNKIIWSWDPETHVDGSNQLTEKYFNWRSTGMQNEYAVRYPVGKRNMHKCLFALSCDNLEQPLTYVESRKEIYIPVYCSLVRKQPQFSELQRRLQQGENLLIVEVDGPIQESLEYYKEKYSVDESFIEDDTILVTEEHIKIMMHDGKHPFGHGYCLAMSLLDHEDWNEPLETYTYSSITDFFDQYSLNTDNLGSYTVSELKDMIREERQKGYQLLLTGRKAEIVERLKTHFEGLQ